MINRLLLQDFSNFLKLSLSLLYNVISTYNNAFGNWQGIHNIL